LEPISNLHSGAVAEDEVTDQETQEAGHTAGSLLSTLFREDRFFLVLSVFIGIFSGLAVVCFRYAIDWCRIYLLGTGAQPSTMRLLLAPTLTGLVIALLVIYVFPLARGSGVNQTKAALFIYNGYIPIRTAIGKFITAALAMGSGQSLGPEDPSLQIGAALEPRFAARAQAAMLREPRYRWLGSMPHARALAWLASSHALVISSRLEGGANIVSEAIRIGIPVLASRIPGNIGLLGERYPGYFATGDSAALAGLMRRFAADAAFRHRLRSSVLALRRQVDPRLEARLLLAAIGRR